MTTTDMKQFLKSFGSDYAGHPLYLDVLGEDQVLIVLKAVPSVRVRFSVESELTEKLDQMGISGEVKVGDEAFDSHFHIRTEQPDELKALLTPELKAKIVALEPFLELELTGREYRLIAHCGERIQEALAALAEVVELTAQREE